MKKRYCSIMAVMAVAALSAVTMSGCGKSAEKAGSACEVYVYNWGEYIDEDVIAEFEEETGSKVVYDMFETNEEMYPVIEAGGVKYDAAGSGGLGR